MEREIYSIEQDEYGKRIHYIGCLYDGVQLDADDCVVYLDKVSEWGIEDDVFYELESCPQYIDYSIGQRDWDWLMDEWAGKMTMLPLSEVTEDTPCGEYYYDSE